MARYDLRSKARELRRQGNSIKSIEKELSVARSSVSRWVVDIVLTANQIEELKQCSLSGAERGRLKLSQIHREKREKRLEEAQLNGKSKLKDLTKREIFIAGISLYWAEGGKSNKRIEFCNSDPKMIEFLMYWLNTFFNVSVSDIVCTVGIHESHKNREDLVKQYWSDLTTVPLSQFYKTRFKKTESKKIYDNMDQHFGTLSIGVRKSTKMYYEMLGLIDGLYMNMPR
ncbi:MAG TPA: hypothetical protein PLD54_04835 [Candidatus Levybacteria bacterium]|nr:hypothetical protein [Candidatus Levybacteria bacterium]